jgi:uncharacterized protein (DUF1697 family)
MNRSVAFLRAINVGGHTVKMDRLRQLFEELGLERVETLIASGNVIFESVANDVVELERSIETHLRQALGYEVATFVRSADEVAAVAAYQPFAESAIDAAHALYVAFLHHTPTDEAHTKLMALKDGFHDFHLHQRELYWLALVNTAESKVSGAQIEKALGAPMTARNITTIRKIGAKVAPEQDHSRIQSRGEDHESN